MNIIRTTIYLIFALVIILPFIGTAAAAGSGIRIGVAQINSSTQSGTTIDYQVYFDSYGMPPLVNFSMFETQPGWNYVIDPVTNQYLFSWEKIPGNDSDRLIDYLRLNYDVDWVRTAEIVKTDNNETIMITSGIHFLSLNLNNEKTELILTIDNGKSDTFFVKNENGWLMVYTNHIPMGDGYNRITTVIHITSPPSATPGTYIHQVSAFYNRRVATIRFNTVIEAPTEPTDDLTVRLNETTSTIHTLFEDIISQNTTLNTSFTGDLNGTLNFTYLEIVLINSGSFDGKGFSRGNWSANIESIPYDGYWQGMLFKKPDERKIHIKGVVSGGLKGVVDGSLIESINGSGIYDQYQANWTISQIGNVIVYAKLY